MAIIYSYPTVTPVKEDLILGTDVGTAGKPTKNFTIDSIIALVTAGSAGLGATIKLTTPLGDAKDPQSNANQPIINLSNISGTGGATFSSYTTIAGANINGQVGTGFTDFTSTRITGTLQTAAQPSVTSLGNLTGLVINGAISGTNVITSTTLAGASNTNIASTLAIKTYVDSNPSGAESLAATLLVGNTTGARDIIVSAGYDITFTDTSKILMGSTVNGDTSIDHNGTKFTIANTKGNIELNNSAAAGSIKLSTAATATNVELDGVAGVDLKFSGNSKLKVLTGGVDITGNLQATGSGTFVNLLNSGTYQDSSGDVGTSGQLLSSTGTGTNWVTEVPLYTWIVETDSGTGSPYTVASGDTIDFVGVGNISTAWDNATKEVRISSTNPGGSGTANQVTYWDTGTTITGAAGFTFAGGATGKVTVAGELEAATLSDGTFSGTAGTYTGGVSITSADFVGALTGNASTATALAAPGTIQLLSGSGATQGVASNAVTYTNGGAVQLTTTLADTTVTAKALTNLPTPTSAAIASTDTILAAMAKLQGQISATTGLAYEGTWDPGTSATGGGTPDLRLAGAKVNGHFYICSAAGSGTPNGDGTTPNSWLTGDWVIYVANGSATDGWQKLDQTNEVLGSGAANKIAKWTATNTLGTGLIEDDGTTVTIGTNGNLTVQGDTILGDSAAADTITLNGPTTFESTGRFKKGLALGVATDGSEYGASGQVLTASTSAGSPPTWTTPTVGVVTSITGNYGITVAGTAAVPTIAVTADANNLINQATAKATPIGADSILINDSADTNALKKATLTSIKTFTAESWILSDGTNTTTISDGDTATFTAAGTGIAVAENNGTITITGSENPGTGTALTLPVWEAGGATLGNSMVSQNAATGTILTISADDPVLVLDDTSAGAGSLEIEHKSSDQSAYTSSGSSVVGASTYGFHIFKQQQGTDTATLRTMLTLDTDNTAKFNGDVSALSSKFISTSSATAKYLRLYAGSGTGQWDIYGNGGNLRITDNLVGSSGILAVDSGATFGGDVSMAKLTATKSGTAGVFNSGTTNVVASFTSTDGTGVIQLADSGGNVEIGAAGNNFVVQPAGGTTQLTVGSSSSTFAGNLEVDGNLTVDGHIIHGGGGGGTGKGGQFTKLFTSISGGSVAFTIDRASTGAMVFDVMLTSDTSSTTSIAKKYTVVATHGTTAPIYNKILDTGPDASGADFTVVFAADGTSNTKIKCTITPVTTATQKIGITIDLGFGQNNATVVMNA